MQPNKAYVLIALSHRYDQDSAKSPIQLQQEGSYMIYVGTMGIFSSIEKAISYRDELIKTHNNCSEIVEPISTNNFTIEEFPILG